MNLIDQNIQVLNDAKFYLERIGQEAYCQPIQLMSGSTIGQHTRHFIEFYQCLISQAGQTEIDYDARQRSLLIEQNPAYAANMIDEAVSELEKLDLSAQAVVKTCNSDCTIDSTVGRELLYNLEHCIHHLALIKIGLKLVAPQVVLPTHFGFARSTILHKEKSVEILTGN